LCAFYIGASARTDYSWSAQIVRILSGFVVMGALFGIGVPLPAFAILLAIISVAYAALGANDLGWAQRLYDLISAAVALQVGYFLAILGRTLIRSKSAATRTRDTGEEEDTKH
jgi:hypothetical protein